MPKKIVIAIIVFSAIVVGLGVTIAFGNTINPNCPFEVKQAIQNWDEGLEARDSRNLAMPSYDMTPEKKYKDALNLRHLFLFSLVTLIFNTPIHSQIYIVSSLKKLFTVAKHYFGVQGSWFRVQSLIAIIITIKKYFERIFLLLLGNVYLATTIIFLLSTILLFYHSTRLCFKLKNLRL